MIKKSITYTAFDDQTYTEDFYFHLSTSELAEMELVAEGQGGLVAKLSAIVATKDGRQIMDTFKQIIADSYGIRSEDGKRFDKSPEISASFMNSAAYDVFFMELLSDPNGASAFINGLVPANLQASADELAARRRHPSMQGFNKKQTPQKPTLSIVPDPVEDDISAGPFVSGYDATRASFVGPKSLEGLSLDELIALKKQEEENEAASETLKNAIRGNGRHSDHDATPEEAEAILNPNGQWDGPVTQQARTFVYTAAELTLMSPETLAEQTKGQHWYASNGDLNVVIPAGTPTPN